MVFSTRPLTCNKQLCINGVALERVASTSFLGVKIDQKLNWKCHIEYVNKKLNKCLGILRKVKGVLSTTCLIKLYNAFILPHINYCNIVWGSASLTAMNKLVTTQKRAIKLALKVPLTTATNRIYEQSKLKAIATIHRIQISIFMYKYNQNLLPLGFCDKYSKIETTHCYNTRQKDLYCHAL